MLRENHFTFLFSQTQCGERFVCPSWEPWINNHVFLERGKAVFSGKLLVSLVSLFGGSKRSVFLLTLPLKRIEVLVAVESQFQFQRRIMATRSNERSAARNRVGPSLNQGMSCCYRVLRRGNICSFSSCHGVHYTVLFVFAVSVL